MVYDLDGDGRAEMACKTADGTVDGPGKVIGDDKASYVDASGKVLSGPEFFTIFDGRTGAALATADYLPPRGDLGGWGGVGGNGGNDRTGNRADRFLACVAYLDGKLPSVIMCRGYYGRSVLAAWDWRGGKLTSRWVFDTDKGYPSFAGQGNHSVSVADVDDDGRDEIVYGSMVVDDDGKGLFSTGLRHGDALHVGDLDPSRPGLEVFGIHENEGSANGSPGTAMYDARTGEILWKTAQGEDVGRGLAADIDPRHPGSECWGGPGGLRTSKGEPIGPGPRSANFAIWWDGDLLREILDGNRISKWDWGGQKLDTVFTATGCASNNGSKATPCLSADLFGDWREEVIFRTVDNKSLRIYSTTDPTEHRITTLMHDPQYRLAIAWQNVGYNQPPHTGFFLGDGYRPRKSGR
jgi:rhamnogalacturonan endolyase